MEKKNFVVMFLNTLIADNYFEEGHHIKTSDHELVTWFRERDKGEWSDLSHVEIVELAEASKTRTDLVLQIITPKTEEEKKLFVLEILKMLSNKTISIPVISKDKSLTYDELVKEVSELTPTGKAFIDELISIKEMMTKKSID